MMSLAQKTAHAEVESVVLLDAVGQPCGTAPKATVHGRDTPLHLAFSLHLRAPDGRILLTRRAMTKRTWPGVWTNAVCGHPGPGEDPEAAILRRCAQELGLDPTLVVLPRLLAPAFRYRAVDASGVVENEVCPVYVAAYRGDVERLPAADSAEVMDVAWARWEDVARTARTLPFLLSPWLVAHLDEPALDAALREPPDAHGAPPA